QTVYFNTDASAGSQLGTTGLGGSVVGGLVLNGTNSYRGATNGIEMFRKTGWGADGQGSPGYYKPSQLTTAADGRGPTAAPQQLAGEEQGGKKVSLALVDFDGEGAADVPHSMPATQPAGEGGAQGQSTTAAAPGQTRKVIREGVMEFEVDS